MTISLRMPEIHTYIALQLTIKNSAVSICTNNFCYYVHTTSKINSRLAVHVIYDFNTTCKLYITDKYISNLHAYKMRQELFNQ